MPTLTIDCVQGRVPPADADGAVIVAIDVIRASTTAVTAAANEVELLPAETTDEAHALAKTLDSPILAGEIEGVLPPGFQLQNSPVAIEQLGRTTSPVVLLSTAGTPLMRRAEKITTTYVSCLRNARAQANHVAGLGTDVLLLASDRKGDFRREDQLCAAWIGGALLDHGYETRDRRTRHVIERFAGSSHHTITVGRSARYLRTSGQLHDLEFVLAHIDDLEDVFVMAEGQVRRHQLQERYGPIPFDRHF